MSTDWTAPTYSVSSIVLIAGESCVSATTVTYLFELVFGQPAAPDRLHAARE